MGHYFLRILIVTNELLNVVLGGNPQMSMSARAGFARAHGSFMGTFWCDFLERTAARNFVHPRPVDMDHCNTSILKYQARMDLLHGVGSPETEQIGDK